MKIKTGQGEVPFPLEMNSYIGWSISVESPGHKSISRVMLNRLSRLFIHIHLTIITKDEEVTNLGRGGFVGGAGQEREGPVWYRCSVHIWCSQKNNKDISQFNSVKTSLIILVFILYISEPSYCNTCAWQQTRYLFRHNGRKCFSNVNLFVYLQGKGFCELILSAPVSSRPD